MNPAVHALVIEMFAAREAELLAQVETLERIIVIEREARSVLLEHLHLGLVAKRYQGPVRQEGR